MGKGNPVKKLTRSIKKTIKNPMRIVTKNPLGPIGGVKMGSQLLTGKQPTTGMGGGFGGSVKGSIEDRSGILRPEYASLRGEDGALKEEFKLDPYKSGMMQKLKAEAEGTGLSPWAQMQMDKQGLEEQNQLGAAQKSQQQALAQAQANMMRLGGMGGGARERMAGMGARDLMMANQGVARQGMMDRMGIQSGDLKRKQDLTGQLAKGELAAQEANLQSLTGDVRGQGDFDMGRYQEQMRAWAAEKGAQAQQAAAAQASSAAKPKGLMGAVSGVVGK